MTSNPAVFKSFALDSSLLESHMPFPNYTSRTSDKTLAESGSFGVNLVGPVLLSTLGVTSKPHHNSSDTRSRRFGMESRYP